MESELLTRGADVRNVLLAVKTGGIVLCGGQGRRMGTPKAWLRVGNEYLLQRVVRTVSEIVHPVVVAAHMGQDLPVLPESVEVVHDLVTDSGPLSGIAAGFATLASRCEAVFVASCDHPLLKPALVTRLIELCGESSGVIPSHEGQTYPLLAVYRTSTRAILEEMLARGDLRAREFAARCGARVVESDDLLDTDPKLVSLRNVNDRAAYADILRILGEPDTLLG